MEKKLDDIGRELGPPFGNFNANTNGGGNLLGNLTAADPGSRFIESQGYKNLFGPHAARSETWTTGLIDVTDGPMQFKGTLGEQGAISGGGIGLPGGAGALTSIPQLVSGIATTLFQPLTIESLLSANLADSPTVRFVVEGTATSGATGVSEGGTKPESTLGLTFTDEQVKKVATVLQVSDELLEDAPSVQAFVNERLGVFVNMELEKEIFRGAAGGATVQGLLTSRNIPVYNYISGTVDNKAVQLFKAMNSMRGSAFVEPEFVCIHPQDYQTLRLLTDTTGQLLGGGPFMGAYGNTTMAASASQLTNAIDSVWNKAVYVTANVGGPGTALIGTRANACVWSRGGLRVEATNSHASLFTTNVVAIRAERRIALSLYRPGGFCEVRFGTAANIA
jgi:HK97 family phage major capsid protein